MGMLKSMTVPTGYAGEDAILSGAQLQSLPNPDTPFAPEAAYIGVVSGDRKGLHLGSFRHMWGLSHDQSQLI